MVVFAHTFCKAHAILPISGSFKMSQHFTSGLISFRIHWFDLLAIQGTLKSLFQHHISKGSVIQHPAFFMVQLSHLYMTTGKTVTLTIWTFVSKVILHGITILFKVLYDLKCFLYFSMYILFL